MRAAILCLLVVGVPAFATRSTLTVHKLSTRDGLPQNTVLDVAQGPDGALHLATYGGLARFDGASFEVQDVGTHPELGTSRLECVAVDSRGWRVVGTSEGVVLRERPEGWVPVPFAADAGKPIRDLVFTPDDRLWIAARRGLFVLTPDDPRARLVKEGQHRDLVLGEHGELIATSTSGVEVHGDRAVTSLGASPVRELALGHDGVLFASFEREVRRYERGSWTTLPIDVGRVSDLLVDRTGCVWVTGNAGIGVWRPDVESWTELSAALGIESGEPTCCVFEDREGDLWIGTQTLGLFQLYESPLSVLLPPPEGHGQIVSVAVDPAGEVFALGKELWHVRDGELLRATTPRPTAIAPARSGGLWMETDSGVERLLDGRRVLAVPAELLPRGRGKLFEASDGALWLGRRASLVRYESGEVRTLDLRALGGDGEVAALFEDRDGRLWVGGLSTLLVLDGADVRVYRSGHDLPLGEIRSFYEDEGSAVWIGTYGGGICRVSDDRVEILDVGRGLHENVASTLVPDGRGHLLVMGNRAIARYAIEDLVAAADDPERRVRGRIFDSGLGISIFEGNGFTQPRSAVGPDGVMWFPTLEGLARFEPALAASRSEPPEPRVSVRVHEPVEVEELAEGGLRFRLRPGEREAQIRFSAADFDHPRQLHFRYRLVGRDEAWQSPADAEIVTFSDLPPGDYRFELESAVGDGPFGNRSASASFHVPPRAWERAWVQGAALVLALGVVAGLGFLRVRTARARSRALAVTVDDRTRELAREVEERKRVELELRRSGEDLEAQVQQRTEELVEALENLERDMRRREELETRLRESEKLEAVGRLAGGLAHDFNNILTSVIGETDLGLAKLAEREEQGDLERRLQRHLGHVREAGLRAARLTRQLLAYSRRQVMVPRVVEPLAVLRGLEPMLRRLVPENIALEIAPDSECRPVRIDPGQLEQVVVNLIANATDAMPGGGRIDVRSHVEERGEDGTWTVLTVTDHGAGLGENELERLFEPFTDEVGGSRGLGLASVQGIVLQSGGTVDVESARDVGTSFVVALPGVTEEPSSPVSTPELPSSPLTVLLVDDDAEVRSVVRSMLEERGVRVFETGDPREALELARSRATELDLLVTDVVMPAMNGRDLLSAVREHRPDLGVLFISGYSREVLGEQDLVDSRTEVLAKPFDAAALFERVVRLAR